MYVVIVYELMYGVDVRSGIFWNELNLPQQHHPCPSESPQSLRLFEYDFKYSVLGILQIEYFVGSWVIYTSNPRRRHADPNLIKAPTDLGLTRPMHSLPSPIQEVVRED